MGIIARLVLSCCLAGFAMADAVPPIKKNAEDYTQDWRYSDILYSPTNDLTDEDERFIRGVVHEQVNNHWFFSVRRTHGTQFFSHAVVTTKEYIAQNIEPTVTGLNFNKRKSLDFASGYVGEHWGFRLESYRPKAVDFATQVEILPDTYNNGATTYLWDTTIRSTGVFAMAEYDFFEFYAFRPFLGLGIGFDANRMNTSIVDNLGNNIGASSKLRFSPGVEQSMGIRWNPLTYVGFEIGHFYRYFSPLLMGPVKNEETRLRIRAKKVGSRGSYVAVNIRFH